MYGALQSQLPSPLWNPQDIAFNSSGRSEVCKTGAQTEGHWEELWQLAKEGAALLETPHQLSPYLFKCLNVASSYVHNKDLAISEAKPKRPRDKYSQQTVRANACLWRTTGWIQKKDKILSSQISDRWNKQTDHTQLFGMLTLCFPTKVSLSSTW